MRLCSMPDIYEYLSALHQGIWEVVIPKNLLTEPLGPEWKFSAINVPTHGTIANYRNGQYHLRETKDEYKVHLDRYDPEKNPFLHLIDDAPLILMIMETLQTIYMTAKDTKKNPVTDFISDQQKTWKYRLILGFILLFISGILFLIALNQDERLFSILLPSVVFLYGILIFSRGFFMRERKEYSKKDLANGILIMGGGFIMELFWEFYLFIIIFILAIWSLGSAYVSFKRVIKDKKEIPQGLWLSLGMGAGSLIFGVFAVIVPEFLLEILIGILAVIIGIIGFGFFLDGYGLRNSEHLIRKQADANMNI